MIGFLFGTLCLIGLVKVLRAGRYGHGACGAGWHGRGWHHHGWHHGHGGWGHHGGGWGGRSEGRGWGGWGAGLWLRGLFERLDTSPGQEKVIKQAVEEMFEATRGARAELEQSRKDVAAALRGGVFDENAMAELMARQDAKLRDIHKAFISAFAKVNEALDESQRRQLADLIEHGRAGFPGRFGGGHFGGGPGGPYRGGRGEWA